MDKILNLKNKPNPYNDTIAANILLKRDFLDISEIRLRWFSSPPPLRVPSSLLISLILCPSEGGDQVATDCKSCISVEYKGSVREGAVWIQEFIYLNSFCLWATMKELWHQGMNISKMHYLSCWLPLKGPKESIIPFGSWMTKLQIKYRLDL